MHGKIYQISLAPIGKGDYASPSDYYENSDDFADYIGDELEDDERESSLSSFANNVSGVFSACGDGVFVYNGDDALLQFSQKWIDRIKEMANGLDPDNFLSNDRLYHLSSVTTRTHPDLYMRVHIMDWNGYAGPASDLFEWARYHLKEGDKIYIGAIIDFHF